LFFLFPAADLPGGGVGFGWVAVEPVVVVFDVGIDLWAPVDVVIVVVADWSDPTAPCVPFPTAACLPRFPLLPR
jgi:hypothetical protein